MNQTEWKKKKMNRFIIVSILLVVGRLYDATTTYLYTPDLLNESNVLVVFFGARWISIVAVQIIFIVGLIYLYFFYLFRFRAIRCTEKDLTLKGYISYLFFGNTTSFEKMFYRIPKNRNAFFAYIGYVTSMTLLTVSYIVGTSTVLLLTSESYRLVYNKGIPYILYGIMVGLAICFSWQFFKNKYNEQKGYIL
ncbi:MAG: hypothetical protein IH596_03720 [Bacteroidales bacterium]|nr:hypothetical protein [Bacteroidales bacterium]